MNIKIFVGGNLQANGYVVYKREKGSCYVIDPGYNGKNFITFIENRNLFLKGIILTHHHYDHVDEAWKLRAHFRVPVMVHEVDFFRLKEEADIKLKDGDLLDLDGEKLKILHTPGHTGGSICILSEKSKVVFTGDTIFDTDLGRTDLSDGSSEDMRKSCINVINQWSNEYTIYPGHEGKATMKQVRMYNQEFLDFVK